MFFRRLELSIRGRLVIWSVLIGLVVTLVSSAVILGVTYDHLHGRVKEMMTLVLADLQHEYVELGGLTPEFRHCVDEDIEEHGPFVTQVIVRSPDGKTLYATPPLRKKHHQYKERRAALADGNAVTIVRDVDDIVDFSFFLGLLLGGIGIVSVASIGFFSRFVGGRILKLNQVVEAKEKAIEELKILTDDIAHDLRTPLTRLNMAAEASLKDGVETKLAETVLHDTGAMVEMINTMLEISQTGFRMDRTPRENLELTGIIRKTAEIYETIAEDEGVVLTVEVPDGPLCYSAHKGKIQQVVGNLLDNALKFTSRGGTVSLALSETAESVCLRVCDTGCGIAPTDIPHLFQRFYRTDASRNLPGNGLGLALVHAIIVSYGGTVTCLSKLGFGSQFIVKLPKIG